MEMERIRKVPCSVWIFGAILLLIACGVVGSAVGLVALATRPQVSEAVYEPTTDSFVRMEEVISQQSTLIAQFVEKGATTETTDQVQPTAAPTNQPTSEPVEDLRNMEISWGWESDWYRSPFRETTRQLSDPLTHETFAEPGMFPGMGNTQTAWTVLNDSEEYLLVPEAGYAYIASNGYCLQVINPEASDAANTEVRETLLCVPQREETIYLTFIRGLYSDGGDADRNRIVVFSDYTRGAAIYHAIGAGAYVSLDWTEDQLENAQNRTGDYSRLEGFSDPNSGDNGSVDRYIVDVDLETVTNRVWLVDEADESAWSRVTTLE